jgi:energy-converting hydrogenase Eha subunit E
LFQVVVVKDGAVLMEELHLSNIHTFYYGVKIVILSALSAAIEPDNRRTSLHSLSFDFFEFLGRQRLFLKYRAVFGVFWIV